MISYQEDANRYKFVVGDHYLVEVGEFMPKVDVSLPHGGVGELAEAVGARLGVCGIKGSEVLAVRHVALDFLESWLLLGFNFFPGGG